jgi:hypothetical protein
MNERIRELLQETYTHFGQGKYRTNELVAEKFAELIVRECAMLVEGFEITQEVALDEYVDYEASAVLKEHFGVEE